MKISNNCVELVKSFEGCYLHAYRCPANVLTIGYGHTGKDVKEGMTITQKQADLYLISDLSGSEKHVNEINDRYKYNFNQNEFDALVSFAFNVGSINQLTGNGKRTKKIIADKMLLYKKAGGRVLKGLERRRNAERELFLKPIVDNVEKTVDRKSYKEIAQEVINGKWGNGQERKDQLTKAGYQYKRVQNLVNEMLSNK